MEGQLIQRAAPPPGAGPRDPDPSPPPADPTLRVWTFGVDSSQPSTFLGLTTWLLVCLPFLIAAALCASVILGGVLLLAGALGLGLAAVSLPWRVRRRQRGQRTAGLDWLTVFDPPVLLLCALLRVRQPVWLGAGLLLFGVGSAVLLLRAL